MVHKFKALPLNQGLDCHQTQGRSHLSVLAQLHSKALYLNARSTVPLRASFAKASHFLRSSLLRLSPAGQYSRGPRQITTCKHRQLRCT